MGRGAFWISQREKSAAGLVVDGLKDGRLQDVAVQWVGRLVVEHLVDAAGIGFGAETAVQTPFLEPGGFEGDTGDFRDAAEHVGQTEGDKSTLVGAGEVGLPGLTDALRPMRMRPALWNA